MNDLSLFAYNCDFDSFIKNYNEHSHKDIVNGCICRGVSFSLDFCKSILNSKLKFPNYVYKVVHSKLIMNNIINYDGIKTYQPFCIWFPDIPSKETCIELSNKFDFLNYSIAILCILMDWEDIFFNLNINDDKFLYDLSCFCGRTFVKNSNSSIINIEKEILELNSSSSVTNFFKFTKPSNTHTIYHPNSSYFKTFIYEYPLGLPRLWDWGIEYHMIKMKDPSYVFSPDEPYLSDESSSSYD